MPLLHCPMKHIGEKQMQIPFCFFPAQKCLEIKMLFHVFKEHLNCKAPEIKFDNELRGKIGGICDEKDGLVMLPFFRHNRSEHTLLSCLGQRDILLPKLLTLT